MIEEPIVPPTFQPIMETPVVPSSPALLVIMSFIAGAGLMAAGLFGYQYMHMRKISLAIATTPMPSESPAATPIIAITTNLKTYTNNRVGFELNYPADKFKEYENKIDNTILPPLTGSRADDDNGHLYIEISTNQLSEPTSLNNWVNKNWINPETPQKNITVNGINAIIFDDGNIEPKSNKYMFILKDNYIIQISAHYLNFSSSSYYAPIKKLWNQDVDPIFSSFKFTRAK